MKNSRLLKIVLVVFLLVPQWVLAATFDNVVAFGDSLTDDGNLYDLTLQIAPSPEDYYRGRFSNGPVWVEYLTGDNYLNCSLDNKAYGGAETAGVTPLGLVEQVNLYVGRNSLPDNALFIVWIGANDLLNGSRLPSESILNIEDALEVLASFGAENILILNLPNLGTLPATIGTDEAAPATLYSQTFNDALADMLDDFWVNYPDVTVYELDTHAFFEDIAGNPAGYGFTNMTEPSPNYYVADNFDNSAGYFFWDRIHPTTEAHAELAEYAFDLLDPTVDDNDVAAGGSNDDSSGCFIGTIISLE